MSASLHEKISAEFSAIEKREEVLIFYACESGSRAWGFASQDSDYDVRFLYLHRPEWYLSIDQKRDTIEFPPDDLMDYSGWDLKKALQLLRKSNPPLLEWMQSPIIYREICSITNLIRAAIATYYSPLSCLHHYLHMAQGNFREYLQGEDVWVKKYLYVLRPLLACIWIEREMGVVPTEFEKLVHGVVADPDLRDAIDALLAKKKAGKELDRGPRIGIISRFVEKELDRLAFIHVAKTVSTGPEPLNQMFRESLRLAWGKS